MNKKTLFVLPMSWVLASCAPTPIGPTGCVPYSGPILPCTGTPSAPEVNLNTNSMKVNPACVLADRGKVIIFKVTPKNQNPEGTVEIFAKKPADKWWLAGTNSPNKNRIIILVPEEAETGGEFQLGDYDYGFRTNTKCVDPRVKVTN